MTVSSLLLLVAFGSGLLGCSSLPAQCDVKKSNPVFCGCVRTAVNCNRLGLVALPGDIPTSAERLELVHNNIKNVSHFPSLPYLYSLDLSYNSIETVSWMSLRALPALEVLSLQENRLKYVQLDTVIAYLPKLMHVNLSWNKLTSFSRYAIGWPSVNRVIVNDNPFHCDCELSWLIDNMACLEGCKWGRNQECCSLCSACFLALSGRFVCNSPSQLYQRHLSTVSAQLTDCEPTHPAKTKLPSIVNDIFLNKSSTDVTTQAQVWKEVNTGQYYQTNSSARIRTSAAQTSEYIVITSPTVSTDTKNGKGERHYILYITIFVTESCLVLSFIACLVRLVRKKNLCCNRRELVNGVVLDHNSIPLRQIVSSDSMIENNLYNGPVAGASNHGPPVAHTTTCTLPTVDPLHQCIGTSSQGLNHGRLIVPAKNENIPPQDQEQSAGILYHEPVAVSNNTGRCVDFNLNSTATTTLYTCLNQGRQIVSGENQIRLPQEQSTNHCVGILYHEPVAVSNDTERCVDPNLSSAATTTLYTSAEPTADSTNCMYNTSTNDEGCNSLPAQCDVKKNNPVFSTRVRTAVNCNRLGLVTLPGDIPPSAERLELANNNIKNVSHFPSLPHLYSLDLSYNSIESVSWMSLRTLPALESLSLQGNRLKHVQLDTVIAYLPKLSHVILSLNKLKSFSKHALGWPQVKKVVLNDNPFHCDCELSWLIDKMACLEGCKWTLSRQACSSSCFACFLMLSGRFVCYSPSHLYQRHLSTVSAKLTDCEPTQPAKTKLPSVENGSTNVTTKTQLWKNVNTGQYYQTYSSARIRTSAAQSSAYIVNTSPTVSTDTKNETSGRHNILYITIFVVESCLVLFCIACFVRLVRKKISAAIAANLSTAWH
uniref:LRRCT domain-containing protein n=1 Tax=Branchiostoma floridae TaxID=7739 RepID=C3YT26_BRAFL|eukprot:XP_002600381.1 hypothetical protein BRAFLDRAFT_99572 [Branchiostoma floridae]